MRLSATTRFWLVRVKRGTPRHDRWFPRSPWVDGRGILLGMASSPNSVTGDGPSPPSWQQVETLGVAEIVMTILEAQKTMPWATAAAISRESHGDVIQVRVSLLESTAPSSAERAEDPPRASEAIAAYATRRLGEDLAAAFGQKDTIILK